MQWMAHHQSLNHTMMPRWSRYHTNTPNKSMYYIRKQITPGCLEGLGIMIKHAFTKEMVMGRKSFFGRYPKKTCDSKDKSCSGAPRPADWRSLALGSLFTRARLGEKIQSGPYPECFENGEEKVRSRRDDSVAYRYYEIAEANSR